ncbi:MAG: lipase family protein [Bacteroidales bacterium]|jgi:pimeloyl-ACP methyl ester carboxylesterase|nr:lipase family protein [Bacteroidales bacterium]MCI1733291.1 lipase family protein [Bacteroidales bacterium]
MKKLWILGIALLFAAFVVACSDKDNLSPQIYVPENSLKVDSSKVEDAYDVIANQSVQYFLNQSKSSVSAEYPMRMSDVFNPQFITMSDSTRNKLFYLIIRSLKTALYASRENGCNTFSSYFVKFNSIGVDGKKIVLSGKLMVPPKNVTLKGIILVSHYTVTDDAECPSKGYQLENLLAGLGYALSFSDYIGFGYARLLPQTFLAESISAQSNVDMGLASYNFLKEQGYTFKNSTNDVWLTGYSQGGAIALATQKLIEEKYADKFNIKKTLCGGGPYDMEETYKAVCSGETSSLPPSLAPLVLLGMDYGYSLHLDFSKFFKGDMLKKYKELYFSKLYTTTDISAALKGAKITDVFTADALNYDSKIMKGLSKYIKMSSLCDWSPKAPIWMYHSTKDDYIPFTNAENAIAGFKRNNSTATIETDFGDHGSHVASGVRYYMKLIDLLK